MPLLDEVISGIEHKVQLLLKKIIALEQSRSLLIEENNKLKAALEAYESGGINVPTMPKVPIQQEEDKKVEVSAEMMQKMKQDIEQYIVEIDKYIEILNNKQN